MAGPTLEVEVKFLAPDLAGIRARLTAAGATRVKARVFERNVRYDDALNSLAEQGRLLRLRQDNGVRLTFKAPSPEDASSEVKIREEVEIGVDSFGRAGTLLERLGFFPRQIYEKFRETWRWGDVEIVLDELPFGDFIELEGPETSLRPAAAELDLRWDNRILLTYLHLMALLKAHYDLPFDDVTFANFEGRECPVAAVL